MTSVIVLGRIRESLIKWKVNCDTMTDTNKEENGPPQVENEPQDEAVKEKKNGSGKPKHGKDWLAVGGIGIEKRRRSSTASYRIENNKVKENAITALYVLILW